VVPFPTTIITGSIEIDKTNAGIILQNLPVKKQ